MRFKAPATSANLGPGFDCAACAFELWNELELTDGNGVTVEGEGADELAADVTNLAVRAYALLADPAGKQFHFVNRIPLERGLGSSAAAIALGLTAARPDAAARGATRGGPRARGSRRQPRCCAARRRHARLGRLGDPDRRPASARGDRRDPPRADLDQRVAHEPATVDLACRRCRNRRSCGDARRLRRERRRRPLREGARRSPPRAVSAVRRARGRARERRRPAHGARRSPGLARRSSSGPTPSSPAPPSCGRASPITTCSPSRSLRRGSL